MERTGENTPSPEVNFRLRLDLAENVYIANMDGTVDAGGVRSAVESPRSILQRRRRGTDEGCSVTPLSMTWPSGCAMNWEERERVSRAALKRCAQPSSTRGITVLEERRRHGTACSSAHRTLALDWLSLLTGSLTEHSHFPQCTNHFFSLESAQEKVDFFLAF